MKATDRQIANARFTRTDLLDTALEPRSYDAIMAFYVLHLVDDPTQVLERIHELLKPDGRLILLWGNSNLNFLYPLAERVGLRPKVDYPFRTSTKKAVLSAVDQEVHPKSKQIFGLGFPVTSKRLAPISPILGLVADV